MSFFMVLPAAIVYRLFLGLELFRLLVGLRRGAEFAGQIALGHVVERHHGNLGGLTGLAELLHALFAHLLHRGARWGQVVTRVEFGWLFSEGLADSAGDGQAV